VGSARREDGPTVGSRHAAAPAPGAGGAEPLGTWTHGGGRGGMAATGERGPTVV